MVDQIGSKIKELRLNLNMTQEDLAIKIGIDKTRISKIEKGDKNITINTLIKVCDALNCKFDITKN